MKDSQSYLVKVLSVGLITLILLSVALFWARKTCQAIFFESAVGGRRGRVEIQPSGLVPELDSASDIAEPSSITTHIGDGAAYHSLGIMQEELALVQGGMSEFHIISGDTTREQFKLIRYDTRRGLLILHNVLKQKKGWKITPTLHIGTNEMRKMADSTLEPFSKPHPNLWRFDAKRNSLIYYDTGQSCFFKIRFNDRTIEKSRQIADVIQLGRYDGLHKNAGAMGPLKWIGPLKDQKPQEKDNTTTVPTGIPGPADIPHQLVPGLDSDRVNIQSTEDLLILESNSDIRMLNCKTLEISDRIASLPVFDRSSLSPDQLTAYTAKPFVFDRKNKGTIVAGLSREATMLWAFVFDEQGRLVAKQPGAIDFRGPEGGWALAIINYLLENLQPPVLAMASYFTASSFEAVNGHAGLFLLPDSWVAIFHRTANEGALVSVSGALLIISPSILLSLILAFRVHKNAIVVGLPRRQKRYWVLATILFGLNAYITYKFVRPRETLITCPQCGRMRRPDMTACHRCQSPWQIPELIPPKWRIMSEPSRTVTND